MSKRSILFGTLALVAALATATPTHAGSTVVTTFSFQSASPALTDIYIAYTGAGTLTPITQAGPPTSTITVNPLTNVADIHFTAGGAGPVAPFTFYLADSTSGPVTGSASFNPPGSSLTDFSLKITTVPEPASIALLGIGMTGFLAFRRLFKKTSVA